MTQEFTVQNLKCGGCANTIKGKLMQLDFVNDVEVVVEQSLVHVNLKSEDKQHLIEETLKHLGYPIAGAKNELTTKAKSFVSCAIGRINN